MPESAIVGLHLVHEGVISYSQLLKARQQQLRGDRADLAEVLVELGFAGADTIQAALAVLPPFSASGLAGEETAALPSPAADARTRSVTDETQAPQRARWGQARESSADDEPLCMGRYQVLRQLGRGGMGVVLLARDPVLDRRVAIKTLRHGHAPSTKQLQRFQREARAVAKLRHPGIVAVYDQSIDSYPPFFVMEYVEGSTLSDRMRTSSWEELMPSLAQVAQAVAYAHDQGVLHRDLKPANVMVEPSGRALVMDFGLAGLIDQNPHESRITREGALMGTPAYMSPEQAAGKLELSAASDVFSLGVILYECLTRTRPFTGETPVEVTDRIRASEPPPPSDVVPDLPPDLEAICLRCLQKDPAARYSDAGALAADLEAYLGGAEVTPSTQRMALWRVRWPALLLGLGVVLVLGVAIGAMGRWPDTEAGETPAETSTAPQPEPDPQPTPSIELPWKKGQVVEVELTSVKKLRVLGVDGEVSENETRWFEATYLERFDELGTEQVTGVTRYYERAEWRDGPDLALPGRRVLLTSMPGHLKAFWEDGADIREPDRDLLLDSLWVGDPELWSVPSGARKGELKDLEPAQLGRTLPEPFLQSIEDEFAFDTLSGGWHVEVRGERPYVTIKAELRLEGTTQVKGQRWPLRGTYTYTVTMSVREPKQQSLPVSKPRSAPWKAGQILDSRATLTLKVRNTDRAGKVLERLDDTYTTSYLDRIDELDRGRVARVSRQYLTAKLHESGAPHALPLSVEGQRLILVYQPSRDDDEVFWGDGVTLPTDDLDSVVNITIRTILHPQEWSLGEGSRQGTLTGMPSALGAREAWLLRRDLPQALRGILSSYTFRTVTGRWAIQVKGDPPYYSPTEITVHLDGRDGLLDEGDPPQGSQRGTYRLRLVLEVKPSTRTELPGAKTRKRSGD